MSVLTDGALTTREIYGLYGHGALRNGTTGHIHNAEEEPEFEYCDLVNDPYEQDNTVVDPGLADAVQEHREVLMKWFCRRSADITPA